MHWIRRAASRADWTAGSKQGDQDGDDGDDDEQLDERERTRSAAGTVSHWATSPGKRINGTGKGPEHDFEAWYATGPVGPQAGRSRIGLGSRLGRSGQSESSYLLGPALPRGAFLLSRLISALSRYSPGGQPLDRLGGIRARRRAGTAGDREQIREQDHQQEYTTRECSHGLATPLMGLELS